MKHTSLLLTGLLFAPLAALHAGDARDTARIPNIVFICADDWAWGDVSCHGSTWLKTPNLDKFLCQSTDFQRFGVLNPVCAPGRPAALTGRYHSRFGVSRNVFVTPFAKSR